MNTFLGRIDLSSNSVFIGVWLICISLCTLTSFFLITASFSKHAPELLDQNRNTIVSSALATAFLTSTPATFFFLFLLRKMNEINLQLGHKLRYDDLTGILNRKAFFGDFSRYCDEKPEHQTDALLVIDADYFKKINDTHGHGIGDDVLVKISNAMHRSVRSTDKVGRIGGEEFAIHLRNVSKELAEEIAERIRGNVKKAAGEIEIPDLELSVSIGLVSYGEKRKLKDLMLVADQLLYKAKESGRDRVESISIEPETIAA